MVKSQIVEVEAVAPQNRQVHFWPAGKTLRGRMDFSEPQNKTQAALRKPYPTPVPGQRVCIDFASGEKWIAEPLHMEQYEEMRAQILQRGYKLPPKKEQYASESTTTWVYHLQRLIDAGLARVVEGELPRWEDMEGKPRKRFISNDYQSETAKMTDVLERMATATEANTKMLVALAEKIAGKTSTPASK
jgi:hypothetical protein